MLQLSQSSTTGKDGSFVPSVGSRKINISYRAGAQVAVILSGKSIMEVKWYTDKCAEQDITEEKVCGCWKSW